MFNSKRELADDVAVTGAALVVTWTSNEPTAGTANTIADGSGISDAEMAQTFANIIAQMNKNTVDIGVLKTSVNS